MKTSLKLIALVLAAGFPCVAFADIFGARLPSSLGAENMIGLSAVVSIGLLFIYDYSRPSRVRPLAATVSASVRSKSGETHCLAA